jgi:hypothetical protein
MLCFGGGIVFGQKASQYAIGVFEGADSSQA